MESKLINPASSKSITYISWLITALSIFSCCSRADYNIVIGFLLLFLRSHYTSDKYKTFTKATLHILIISLLFDIIWIWQYTSYWKHGEETSELWQSLSVVHNISYYLGIVEFLIKIPAVLFLYKQFNGLGGQIRELLSLNYYSNKL